MSVFSTKKRGAFLVLGALMLLALQAIYNDAQIFLGLVCNNHDNHHNEMLWATATATATATTTAASFDCNNKTPETTTTTTENRKPFIAIVSCIRFGKPPSAVTALEEILIPSLLASITSSDWKKYRIELVLGYDRGDVYWEIPKNRQRARDLVPPGLPFAIHFLSIVKEPPPTPRPRPHQRIIIPFFHHFQSFFFKEPPLARPHRIPFNELCRATYEYGADYIVRVNDDTKFTSKGWITLATQQLAQYDPPNVGVIGPNCEQNTNILTHDMVHRTHLDIFDDYYPSVFDNWWVDNWISAVYGQNRTTTVQDWTVTHVMSKYNIRYKVNMQDERYLDPALADGRQRIHSYLQDRRMHLKNTYTPVLGTYRLANVEGPMRCIHEQLVAAAAAQATNATNLGRLT